MIVERYGPGWIERDLFAFSLELPRVLCSAWIHVSNANMLCQLARRPGHRPAPEIVRRTDDCETEARLYFHCHHAFAEAFPKAPPGVKTFFHDIDQSVCGDDFELQVWMGADQWSQDVADNERRDAVGHVQAYFAERRVAKLIYAIEGRRNQIEGSSQARVKHFSGVGE